MLLTALEVRTTYLMLLPVLHAAYRCCWTGLHSRLHQMCFFQSTSSYASCYFVNSLSQKLITIP